MLAPFIIRTVMRVHLPGGQKKLVGSRSYLRAAGLRSARPPLTRTWLCDGSLCRH
jgi:hypothetical protein